MSGVCKNASPSTGGKCMWNNGSKRLGRSCLDYFERVFAIFCHRAEMLEQREFCFCFCCSEAGEAGS